MKKIFYLFNFICTYGLVQSVKAQNVGIGTTTPANKLTVQTASNTYGITHTDGTIIVGSYVGSGGGWLGTKSGHPLYLFAANGAPAFTIATNSNIGIGVLSPANSLQVGPVVNGFTGYQIAIGNGSESSGITTLNNGNSLWQSTQDISLMPKNGNNGRVGILTLSPANFLQVGDLGTSGYNNNHIAFGNGSQASGLTILGNGNSVWEATQGISLMPSNANGNGNVGIDVLAPANALQIGNVGATGYAGNHIAFGNGTQASGITQTATVAQWFSTTDIALMPRGNGHGRVGINTTSPLFPLEVGDYVFGVNSLYKYFNVDNDFKTSIFIPNVSIKAEQNIMAAEFDAYSDARIKDIKGISNSMNDLALLNAIQVTDYTLKDRIKNGDKPFKKVIAQQVESVYPQLVSKHVDFIPNVYQAADKMEKTAKGLLLHFDKGHHLSKQAKKIKLLSSDEHTMTSYEIVEMASDKEVMISAPNLTGEKVFVYGEQVGDFRTVDYEGLTTLNISATQELSKLITQQQETIKAQNEKIAALTTTLEKLQEDVKSLQKK
jgi:uncharacterized coiled-coil protein SlyX